MPVIQPYQNTTEAAPPPDIAAEAFNSAARRVGPLEREAGEAVGQGLQAVGKAVGGIMEQRENDLADRQIMRGLVGVGKMHTSHMQQINALVNDPANQNNPDAVVNKFLQDTVAPEAEQFVNSFTTPRSRKWAQEEMGRYQQAITEQGANDATAVIGHAALINAHASLTQLSNNAASDPAALDQSMSAWQNGIKELTNNPRLTTEARSKLTEFGETGAAQIAMAGVKALMDRSPAAGMGLLNQYKAKGVLDGAQINALAEHADSRARITAYDQRIAQTNQDRADKQTLNQDINQLYASTIKPDGTMAVPTGPNGYLSNLAKLSETPGARLDPSLIPNAFRYSQAVIDQQNRGTPDVTNPTVYDDFRSRMLLDPSDPSRLTLSQVLGARGARQLSDKDTQFFTGAVNEGFKNPQFIQNEKQLNEFLKQAISPVDRATMPSGAVYAFNQDRAAKFHAGLAAGDSPADLLDPLSKKFIGGLTEAEKSGAALQPAQQAAPYTAQQKVVGDAVDLATQVAGQRVIDPQAVTDFLKAGGVTNVDAKNPGGICAALVNSALKQAGIEGTGSQLASSFKNWGFEVAPAQAQRGDVFYVPAEGYTGHVGFATGRVRPSPTGGGVQIEVVSSHLQGSPDNSGGVEWRNAAGMTLRRASPAMHDIMASPGVLSRAWSAITGPSTVAPRTTSHMGGPPGTDEEPYPGQEQTTEEPEPPPPEE